MGYKCLSFDRAKYLILCSCTIYGSGIPLGDNFIHEEILFDSFKTFFDVMKIIVNSEGRSKVVCY